MTKDAIKATFHTARPVPSRGVVSFVFDVPTAHATAALELLGGFPDGGESVWVAIARLTPEAAERKPDARERYQQSSEGEQAVVRSNILTGDATFRKWCNVHTPSQAGEFIRTKCGIKSRAEIATDPAALQRFLALETAFKYRDTPYAGGKP